MRECPRHASFLASGHTYDLTFDLSGDSIFSMTIEARVDVQGIPIPFYRHIAKAGEQVDLDRPDYNFIAEGWPPRKIAIIDPHHMRLQVGRTEITSSNPSRFRPVADGHYEPTRLHPTSYDISYPPGSVLEKEKINETNIVTRRNWWGKRTTYHWKPGNR